MATMRSDEANPFLVGPNSGTSPRIETLLSQLTSSRHYLLSSARELGAEQLDAVAPGCPNSIGSLLAHLAAAERMFQNITCRGRQFSDEEADLRRAFGFESNWLVGSDIETYRARLEEIREETVGLVQARGDEWLESAITFMGRPSNYHYYWTHLLMDEARHTGQIILIRKHLMPGNEPSFNPYIAP